MGLETWVLLGPACLAELGPEVPGTPQLWITNQAASFDLHVTLQGCLLCPSYTRAHTHIYTHTHAHTHTHTLGALAGQRLLRRPGDRTAANCLQVEGEKRDARAPWG